MNNLGKSILFQVYFFTSLLIHSTISKNFQILTVNFTCLLCGLVVWVFRLFFPLALFFPCLTSILNETSQNLSRCLCMILWCRLKLGVCFPTTLFVCGSLFVYCYCWCCYCLCLCLCCYTPQHFDYTCLYTLCYVYIHNIS